MSRTIITTTSGLSPGNYRYGPVASVGGDNYLEPFANIPNEFNYSLASYFLDSTNLPLGSSLLTQGGLYGQYFNGDWRSTISTGNIGTLPLSSPTKYTAISYGTRGDYYGFIAIGYFIPPTTGTYTFYTSSDDGSGVWVGDIASASSGRTTSNAVVNNNMGGGQGDTKRSGTISLTAGVAYPIRIVHEEGTGGDNLTFSWAGPNIAETTSLTQYFYYYQNGTNYAVTIPTIGYSEKNILNFINRTPIGTNNPRISFRSTINVYSTSGIQQPAVVNLGTGGGGGGAPTITQYWY